MRRQRSKRSPRLVPPTFFDAICGDVSDEGASPGRRPGAKPAVELEAQADGAPLPVDVESRTRDSCIFDVPEGALAHVGSYLYGVESAFLAAAMTGCDREPSLSASDSAIRSALPYRLCRELDFARVSRRIPKRLTDDDLRAVLSCIDAKNKLKRLKLAGCVNITGKGLDPLRGSVVLQQIDLSLVGQHKNPNIIEDPRTLSRRDPMISEADVLPVLTSIVNARGNSLKYVQLPHVFRREESRLLTQFISRYNEILRSHRSRCSKCDGTLRSRGNEMWMKGRTASCADDYGVQHRTCYGCLAFICPNCLDERRQRLLGRCAICERCYCADCDPSRLTCTNCSEFTCTGCKYEGKELLRSDDPWDDDDMKYHIKGGTCDRCGYFCADCVNAMDFDYGALEQCDECRSVFCDRCGSTEDGKKLCQGCVEGEDSDDQTFDDD